MCYPICIIIIRWKHSTCWSRTSLPLLQQYLDIFSLLLLPLFRSLPFLLGLSGRVGTFLGLLWILPIGEWTIRYLFLGRNIFHMPILALFRSSIGYQLKYIVGLLIFGLLQSCLRNSYDVWIPSIALVILHSLYMFESWLNFEWIQVQNIHAWLFRIWKIFLFFLSLISNDKGVSSHGTYVRREDIFSFLPHCEAAYPQRSALS